jgi:hypothetical protein
MPYTMWILQNFHRVSTCRNVCGRIQLDRERVLDTEEQHSGNKYSPDLQGQVDPSWDCLMRAFGY